MKRTGVDNKKRFTIKLSDGTTKSFGTCNPAEDERFDIVEGEIFGIKKYFLVQYQQHDIDYSQPERERTLLADDALVANGYYSHENDEFITPEKWLNER